MRYRQASKVWSNLDAVIGTEVLLVVEARELARSGRATEIRERAGLSKGEMGKAIGVATATVSRWESCQRRPRGAPAVRWVRFLRSLEKLEARTA